MSLTLQLLFLQSCLLWLLATASVSLSPCAPHVNRVFATAEFSTCRKDITSSPCETWVLTLDHLHTIAHSDACQAVFRILQVLEFDECIATVPTTEGRSVAMHVDKALLEALAVHVSTTRGLRSEATAIKTVSDTKPFNYRKLIVIVFIVMTVLLTLCSHCCCRREGRSCLSEMLDIFGYLLPFCWD